MIEQLITSELPEGWANAYRAELQSTLKEIRRASAREPDALTSIADRYDRTARKFISIMANVPGLSAIPRLRWEVPSHCKVFDELASILDEFEGLAKSQHPWEVTAAAKRVTRFLSDLLFWADGPGSVEPASVPAQPAAPAAAELDVPKSPKVIRGVCLRKIAEVCEPGDAVQQKEAIAKLRKSSASLPKVGFAARHRQMPLFDPKIAADFAYKNALCDNPKDILPMLKEHVEDCRTD